MELSTVRGTEKGLWMPWSAAARQNSGQRRSSSVGGRHLHGLSCDERRGAGPAAGVVLGLVEVADGHTVVWAEMLLPRVP